jgi:hypothetical protein
MLARSPAALKKRRYRRRLRDGVVVLSVEVKEAQFVDALLLAKASARPRTHPRRSSTS